jgi:putative nucleotidyltransferase with HDIG domain
MPIGEDDLASWAAAHAETMLAPLGRRWQHVQGVATRARDVASALPELERLWLVAAAYLHDIGYGPGLELTGLHQLDGARHLRSIGAPERLSRLVAHHSCARFEAEERSLWSTLSGEFAAEESPVADALAFCDLVTDGAGEFVDIDRRLADIRARYAPDDLVVRALARSEACMREAVRRTEERLVAAGVYPM